MAYSRYAIEHANGETFYVRARTPEEAAFMGAKLIYGHGVTARRATGDAGKSGQFAAYRYDEELHASNEVGSPFHVR